jgi:ribonucleoside-diphosphate reductase alpha chain
MFATQGLDLVIDENNYPTNCTKKSNNLHRPIGLGVQGLVDVYMAMGYPFESAEASALNCAIHETIYHAAMTMSIERAKSHGVYSSFPGSPLSQGKFQFDLWESDTKFSGMYDWNALRESVMVHGARNSLLVALMPTASTSQIMGNTESFECINGNIARRETGSGQFLIFNKYLRKVLRKYGRDNEETANEIILNEGSVKTLSFLTQHERNVFKTAYEIKQRAVIDQSADRGHFVCQSQSMNLFLAVPDQDIVTTMLIYGWSKGLKTGSYYIRSKNASEENKALGMGTVAPVQRVAPSAPQNNAIRNASLASSSSDDDENDGPVCTMKDGCVSCGS